MNGSDRAEAGAPAQAAPRETQVDRDPTNPGSREGSLNLQSVCKVYDSSGSRKLVLQDIHLRVMQGEFVSIVGPSGSGKSTLLRLILGEEEPTSGLLHLDGEPLGSPDTRRGIVPQHYG